jgi:hypothetical protein
MGKPPLGSGQRFSALSNKIESKEGYSKEKADATAAMIGRKKYGAGKMNALAMHGRMRAARGK